MTVPSFQVLRTETLESASTPSCSVTHVLSVSQQISWINLQNTWDFSGGSVLRLCASNVVGAGSIPGWETKIPHVTQHSLKKRKTPHPESSHHLLGYILAKAITCSYLVCCSGLLTDFPASTLDPTVKLVQKSDHVAPLFITLP